MKKVLAILILIAVVAGILVSQGNQLVEPVHQVKQTISVGKSPVPQETDFASIHYDYAGEVIGVLPMKYGSVVQVSKYENTAKRDVFEYKTSETFQKGQPVTISLNLQDEVVGLTA